MSEGSRAALYILETLSSLRRGKERSEWSGRRREGGFQNHSYVIILAAVAFFHAQKQSSQI